MGIEQRQGLILKEIEDRGSVSVMDLAVRLGVSEMTIRRDLTLLERGGFIRRVHGGAVGARGRSYEPPLLLRATENQAAKGRIGAEAAALVADGDSLALDVGSTTLEVAHHLVGRRNLTIITSSLNIANLMSAQPGIRLILTGGILRPGESSLVGDLALHAYRNLFVDRLFLGVGGIDIQAGLTEYNWDDALVKQAMVRSAKEVIVVADSSKFEKVAFAGIAPLSVVHQLVTNQSPPDALNQELTRLGIVVHVAGKDDAVTTEPFIEVQGDESYA